ncbi:MAG: hypothetical protein WAM18_07795 [Halobacillus sp.]
MRRNVQWWPLLGSIGIGFAAYSMMNGRGSRDKIGHSDLTTMDNEN